MRVEIAKLHKRIGATMIYVTHDQVEAMTLADRIVVLRGGLVEQIGSPADLYDAPANMFVAGFIGSPRITFLPGRVEDVAGAGVAVASPALSTPLRVPGPFRHLPQVGEAVTLGFRSEFLQIDAANPALSATVEITENLGASTIVYARTPSDVEIVLSTTRREPLRPGDPLPLSFSTSPFLFDAQGAGLVSGRVGRVGSGI